MSSDPDKPRWPRAEALAVALMLRSGLRPVCHRIEIAGSLRREKPTVGDIELVYISSHVEEPDPSSLLGDTHIVDLATQLIERHIKSGLLARRTRKDGTSAFGLLNKMLVHVPTGIPVDLFATTEDCWFNYLVCRTGGAESNMAIAKAAIARGEKWNPYGPGFTRRNGIKTPMRSEEAVFAFVGLPYLQPRDRR